MHQVAAFAVEQNAEKFASQLRKEGKEAVIKRGLTKNRKTIYRVFVKKSKEPSKQKTLQAKKKDSVTHKRTDAKGKVTIPKAASSQSTVLSQDVPARITKGQVASYQIFHDKERAERFADQIRKDGYQVTVSSFTDADKKILYSVFAEKGPEKAKKDLHPNGMKKDASRQDKPPVEDTTPVKMTASAQKEVAQARQTASGETPESRIQEKPKEEKLEEAKPAAVVKPATSFEDTTRGASLSETGKTAPPLTSTPTDTVSFAQMKGETKDIKRSIEETPVGIVKERPTESVFGSKGGFIHPFLSVTEYYTDNAFFSKDDKKSDFITVITPGIWLSIPHVYEKLLRIESSNLSPGGFSLSRYNPETFQRYQSYLFYNADIERFSRYTSGNAVSHNAEGLFQYNLRGGLSFELVDQFMASHDVRGTGITSELNKFRSNLANFIVTYKASDRFKLRADYSNFLVNYDASRNDFRDRTDNSVSGYIFYRMMPKTSLFVEYAFLDINYKEDNMSNSKEHHYFGGIQWDITVKSRGSIKAGYGVKDFNDPAIDKGEDLILEAQIDYKFTPKTSLILRASRKTNETNISTADYMLTNTAEIEYLQRMTGKITADIKLSYINDRYKGRFTFNNVTKNLEDDYFSGAFALQYKFKEWLQMDLGYIHNLRESSFVEFDYITNTVFIRLTGSL